MARKSKRNQKNQFKYKPTKKPSPPQTVTITVTDGAGQEEQHVHKLIKETITIAPNTKQPGN